MAWYNPFSWFNDSMKYDVGDEFDSGDRARAQQAQSYRQGPDLSGIGGLLMGGGRLGYGQSMNPASTLGLPLHDNWGAPKTMDSGGAPPDAAPGGGLVGIGKKVAGWVGDHPEVLMAGGQFLSARRQNKIDERELKRREEQDAYEKSDEKLIRDMILSGAWRR